MRSTPHSPCAAFEERFARGKRPEKDRLDLELIGPTDRSSRLAEPLFKAQRDAHSFEVKMRLMTRAAAAVFYASPGPGVDGKK